jgi:Ni,Fe-hydrogenase I small subunit
MYKNCPHQWKLTYIDKIRDFEPSMFLVFGTAMHEVLQKYIHTMYNETVVKADSLDLNTLLADTMKSEYKKAIEGLEGDHFSCQEEMNDFYQDGVAIIEEFKRRRGQYFSIQNY